MTLIIDNHPIMRMQRLGSIIVVQPWSNGAVAGESLSCDLETGTLAMTEHPAIEKDFTTIYGVLGISMFEAGPAMVVITAAEHAAVLRGHQVMHATRIQVLADSGNRKWKSADHTFLRLLHAGVDPQQYGGKLYFACGGDPTLTTQQYQKALGAHQPNTEPVDTTYATTPAWRRAEPAFFWNKSLAQPLLDAGMHRFVPTAFVGFVQQLTGLDVGGHSAATLTLIARRSTKRAGTRQWRRGADMDANVANFVESEQIIAFEDGSMEASFVQIRGSIPILWSQSPNLKYKIPITIAAPNKYKPIVESHARQLTEKYGRVTAINLANQTGREGKLSAAYADAAATIASDTTIPFRLVPFDFHKQCGATNYANLENLWKDIESDFLNSGYWYNASQKSHQTGVFRTNCIDTLDRTNVVQGLLARRALEHVLRRVGLLTTQQTLATTFPTTLEPLFRVMWADHGDEISRQYAGTGAMKSAFTRTGKRDLAGLLDDGAKSLTRYFLNNFRDGVKQDAIDLVTGSYKVEPGKPVPFRAQGSPALPLVAATACVTLAVINSKRLVASGELMGAKGAQQVFSLLISAALIVQLMFKFGRQMVNTPCLKQNLTKPWAA